MGLLKVIRKTKLKDKEIRILILGLDNAGKTTILKNINNEDINKIEPTIGFNIKSIRFNEYILNFWDIGGQKSIRNYWKNYFENTDALIWVVDSIDIKRIHLSKIEINKILKYDNIYKTTLLIFCNKQDINGSLSIDEINDLLDIKDRNYKIIGTSGINGQGIIEGLNWMINDINNNKFNFF